MKKRQIIDQDDICVASKTKRHIPDWNSVQVNHDGDEIYIDVNCSKCGISGCIGTREKLIDGIQW